MRLADEIQPTRLADEIRSMNPGRRVPAGASRPAEVGPGEGRPGKAGPCGRLGLAAALALAVAACGGDDALLAASDVTVMAPIPGQDRTVGYLALDNRGAAPVTLTGIASPQFERVEMHATIIDGGMSTMQRIDSLTIAARSRVEFAAGGRHLMLFTPREALEPGNRVTLEFRFDRSATPETLTVEAPLVARMPGGGH